MGYTDAQSDKEYNECRCQPATETQEVNVMELNMMLDTISKQEERIKKLEQDKVELTKQRDALEEIIKANSTAEYD
jgi:hypothetical protein